MKPTNGIPLDTTEPFPHLAAAPIVEAVIHWRARAGNWPDVRQLRQALTERFPDYPEYRRQHLLEEEGEINADGSATQVVRTTWHGFRLVSNDKLHVVQFTRDGIVFSRLTPYEHWDAFVAEGWRFWRAFMELTAPPEVQRLGVRFINRIALAKPDDVEHYLTSPPECLKVIGLPTAGFLYQSRHSVPGHAFEVTVVRTVQPPGPPEHDEFGMIIDIDAGTTQALSCDDATLGEQLSFMHWLKNKVFFSLLLPDVIERFKGKTP
jgi:uncharacterized protein (TIGR04255 family)